MNTMRISSQNFSAAAKIIMMVLLLSNANLRITIAAYGQARPQAKSLEKSNKQNDELAAFLSAPIDLIAFKNKKGPSNSGSIKASPWIYKPKEPGFFYRYMLFTTPMRYSEGERFFGFSVVVYKFGKEIGDYYDSNETLVAIWCRLNDPDLGQANLVGRFASEIKTRFGKPFTVIGDVLIYHSNGRALSVHTKDGVVDWFKYVRLSRDIDTPKAVPEPLLKPGPGW